jgi:hypothetical protein
LIVFFICFVLLLSSCLGEAPDWEDTETEMSSSVPETTEPPPPYEFDGIDDALKNHLYVWGEKVSLPCTFEELPEVFKNYEEKDATYYEEDNVLMYTVYRVFNVSPSGYESKKYVVFGILDCNPDDEKGGKNIEGFAATAGGEWDFAGITADSKMEDVKNILGDPDDIKEEVKVSGVSTTYVYTAENFEVALNFFEDAWSEISRGPELSQINIYTQR